MAKFVCGYLYIYVYLHYTIYLYYISCTYTVYYVLNVCCVKGDPWTWWKFHDFHVCAKAKCAFLQNPKAKSVPILYYNTLYYTMYTLCNYSMGKCFTLWGTNSVLREISLSKLLSEKTHRWCTCNEPVMKFTMKIIALHSLLCDTFT